MIQSLFGSTGPGQSVKASRGVKPAPNWSTYLPSLAAAASSSLPSAGLKTAAATSSSSGSSSFLTASDASEQSGPPWDLTEINEGLPDNTLDKDDFLMLFIEQLQNQDPLNPMEADQFVAQLATFSQLEQQYNTNELLTTIAAYQSSINSAQSMSLLGRHIQTVGNLITVADGQATPISIALTETATVTMRIYDSEGEQVRTISLGQKTRGIHDYTWDGLDDDGDAVEDGAYTVRLEVRDADDNLITNVSIACQGEVTGIRFDENGVPLLLVGPYDPSQTDDEGQPIDNRIEVEMGDILEILTPSASTTDQDSSSTITTQSQRNPLGLTSGFKVSPATVRQASTWFRRSSL